MLLSTFLKDYRDTCLHENSRPSIVLANDRCSCQESMMLVRMGNGCYGGRFEASLSLDARKVPVVSGSVALQSCRLTTISYDSVENDLHK